MKFTIIFILFFALFFGFPSDVSAREAGAAATLAIHKTIEDSRINQLRTFLASHNSPLTDYAEVFVKEADKHNLNWRLVAAIAGTESTFGKHIPPRSYNAWGWGIPTGTQSGLGFTDWEHGIRTVSEGLAKNYYGKGAKTIYDVGWIYAANGNSWGNHVTFFMNKIDSFIPNNPDLLEVRI